MPEHYLEANDRRYETDHDGAGVPYDYTCAYLLGVDGRSFLDEPLRQAVTAILGRFDDPHADVVGFAIGEKGRLYIDDESRTQTFELFRWYRLGLTLGFPMATLSDFDELPCEYYATNVIAANRARSRRRGRSL